MFHLFLHSLLIYNVCLSADVLKQTVVVRFENVILKFKKSFKK